MSDEIEIITESSCEVDTYKILPKDMTDHTARWYYEHLGDGFDEEIYYLLECCSREPEKANEIVRLCQYIVDERQSQQLENFGKNEPTENGNIYISIKELEYDIADRNIS